MIRAVIDTNVTVSGLLFGGLPLKIIHAALARRFEWIISPVLINELERVLRSEKFALSDHEIQVLTAPLLDIAEIVVPEKTINVITRCPADNRVLECAMEGAVFGHRQWRPPRSSFAQTLPSGRDCHGAPVFRASLACCPRNNLLNL